jgi:hypothetical protein
MPTERFQNICHTIQKFHKPRMANQAMLVPMNFSYGSRSCCERTTDPPSNHTNKPIAVNSRTPEIRRTAAANGFLASGCETTRCRTPPSSSQKHHLAARKGRSGCIFIRGTAWNATPMIDNPTQPKTWA